MNAKKLALRIAWSSELNEDSLIPIIANYRNQAVRAMQNAIDNVIINGDTATAINTNVNLIDGTPTTSPLPVPIIATLVQYRSQ
jgi:HK97 family phage major capsid protein